MFVLQTSPPRAGLLCNREAGTKTHSRLRGGGAPSAALLSLWGLGAWYCSLSLPTWAVSLGVGPKQPPEPPTCPRCHGNDSAHVDEEEREEKRGEVSRCEDGRGLLRVPYARVPTPQLGPALTPISPGTPGEGVAVFPSWLQSVLVLEWPE